ncbi:hypothetical protein B0H17DRAFT_1079936 [Mycena rosella]|uniref:Uncharacterized protein n=1 Tax=Mycena rosella TaxID=1033263 RepID=A0AAD7GC16_MYCRO|nr:hypothetical protein B0H17DRAFT_1079936 [Mycena rosella]
MWKSHLGLAKIIYLWNRYFSLIAIWCELLLPIRVQGVTSTVIIGTVDFVLMLRVWILFGRPRVLVWLLAGMVIDFLAYAQMTSMLYSSSPLLDFYPFHYSCETPLQTFVMFAMTVYKCCTTLDWNSHHVMPVWKLFLRDGLVWFLAVFAAAGAELLIWTMRRETLKQLLVVCVFF